MKAAILASGNGTRALLALGAVAAVLALTAASWGLLAWLEGREERRGTQDGEDLKP